jgi:DNA polymerase
VTLDARRHELWRAMGLGPVWQRRGAPIAEAGETAADPRAAHIARLDWDELVAETARCRACPLGERRKQAVFGVGHRHAEWMLVGEAPGAEEDARGEPFVGQAGKLLDCEVLDHIVLGAPGRFVSLKERGLGFGS